MFLLLLGFLAVLATVAGRAMATIAGGRIIEGSGLDAPFLNAGAPVNGTDEVQTVTHVSGADGGTFRLKFDGFRTSALAWNVSAADMQTALEALPSIGSGNVSVSGSAGGPYTVTFQAGMGKKALDLMTVDDNLVTDGGVAHGAPVIAESVAGVTATGLGMGVGALLIDTTNKTLYQNAGTAAAPVWVKAQQVASGIADQAGYGPFTNAGAPVNGTTLDEIAEKGALLIDTTNAILYINTGTKSSSTWTKVGTQS